MIIKVEASATATGFPGRLLYCTNYIFPTGNLDSKTTIDVMGLLKKSSKEYNQTIMMVTHNEMLAQSCDAILCIMDGKLKKKGI